MRPTLALLTSLPLLLAACGGPADPKALADSGFSALGKSNHEAALADFESALAAIGDDSAHAQYRRAKFGYYESLANVDAKRCQTEFLAFAAENELDAGDYVQIANVMMGGGAGTEAVHVMHAGKERFPENSSLEEVLVALSARATAGDAGAASALASLGYM